MPDQNQSIEQNKEVSTAQEFLDPKMKILIGCDTFAPNVNGAARFAERLAAGLTQRGHHVHIVAPSPNKHPGSGYEVHEGQKMFVYRLRSWRWRPHDWMRFALPWTIRQNSARILDEVQPDVVHVQSHVIVGRGLLAQAQKRGIRVVATNHIMPENMMEFSMMPFWVQKYILVAARKDAQRFFSKAAVVTTPTRRAAEFLEEKAHLTEVQAISCGIHAQNYTPDFSPRMRNHLLFVGRVTGEKHLDVLLRAFARLPKDLEASLQIVGQGDQSVALQRLATHLGVSSRVDFSGYLTEEQLRKAYSEATLFMMPSIAELQSIATMEAMASGLPVVAADAMALPHLVHDGENGFLFRAGDATDCANKIEKALRLPEHELLLMKRASLDILKIHDIETTITRFEELYSSDVDISCDDISRETQAKEQFA